MTSPIFFSHSVQAPQGLRGFMSSCCTATAVMVIAGVMAMCERSEEHTSELQAQPELVCRLLLEKKNKKKRTHV